MLEESLHAAVRQQLQAERILIVSHVRPDGDAIGSLLGLGVALQQAGRKVQMVLGDGLPAGYRHLPGSPDVRTAPEAEVDLVVTVDCAELKRTGRVLDGLGQPGLNIDHHVTNERFARLNLIDLTAVATASVLQDGLPRWGLAITPQVAAALLTGLVADTIGFRTSNMTPHALRQAADLMEAGADLPDLYMRALVRRTFEAARYWGAGLSSLSRQDGLVWGTLTLEDRCKAGYSGNDDADLINLLSSIDDSAVALIFVEQRKGQVKVSWRAIQPGLDVSAVASSFGGGGHAAAAGADLAGTLEQVQEQVLSATRQQLGL